MSTQPTPEQSAAPDRIDPVDAPYPQTGTAPGATPPSSGPWPVDKTAARPPRTVRVSAIVWGLVVVVAGIVALAVAGGADVDGGALAIGVLGGAGLALVVGSILTATRRRR